jgi:hypothetical protein
MAQVPAPDADTVDFIYQHTRGALDGHVGQARALDAKTAQVFAAATVVIGLAGATHDANAPGGLLIAALVFYGLTLLGSVAGLWPATLRGSDYGGTLWPEHHDQPPSEIKHAIVADIAEASSHNEDKIKLKAWLLTAVLVTTGVEAILVGIALTVARLG